MRYSFKTNKPLKQHKVINSHFQNKHIKNKQKKTDMRYEKLPSDTALNLRNGVKIRHSVKITVRQSTAIVAQFI